jgi:hypothetical protein
MSADEHFDIFGQSKQPGPTGPANGPTGAPAKKTGDLDGVGVCILGAAGCASVFAIVIACGLVIRVFCWAAGF